MFTGIVEAYGKVTAIEPQGPGIRLAIRAPEINTGVRIGDSICLNGCCLTVVQIAAASVLSSDPTPSNSAGDWHFDAGAETLSRTNLGKLVVGSRVNLERSLAVGDRMGGHFVTGHIDCVGKLVERHDEGEWSKFWIKVPGSWTRHMAPKGSVTVDGVSLTLVDVEPQRFSLALIPHTLNVTTLGALSPGDPVNIETDVLAKYIERLTSFESENPGL